MKSKDFLAWFLAVSVVFLMLIYSGSSFRVNITIKDKNSLLDSELKRMGKEFSVDSLPFQNE